jgi:hypothetical protein
MNSGYPGANLSKGGKTKIHYIHHLVAFSFIGPRPAEMQINHKDCDKWNNAVRNLEYISHAENVRHAARMGRLAARPRQKKNALGQFTSAKACPQPHAAA